MLFFILKYILYDECLELCMIVRIRVLFMSVYVEEYKWFVFWELVMVLLWWEICSIWFIVDGLEVLYLLWYVMICDVYSSDDGVGGMGNVCICFVFGFEK